MKCSICDNPIPVQPNGWARGNNAAPINDGRCCDMCNALLVIPTRLERMRRAPGLWTRPPAKEDDDRD